MSKTILEIKNLQIAVEGKKVLGGFDLQIKEGEVGALMGPNGSGKSSIAMTLLGNKNYEVSDKSKITFLGKDLLSLSVDERARAGLFVAWQSPVMIPGLSVFNFCKSISKPKGTLVEYKKQIEEFLRKVRLPKEYVSRGVNEGFSGGERKRLEMLQLFLLKPKLAVLDEIDSGLDREGVLILSEIIAELSKEGTALLIISHNTKLIEKLGITQTWTTTN